MVAVPELPEVYTSPEVVEQAIARTKALWAPPPDWTVSQFADAEIIVATGPRAGARWRTDVAPYQRGIMDAVHEPHVEIIAVMGSSQWGKTAMTLAIAGYHMAHDPCDILVVQPTQSPQAEAFARRRLDKMIKASPALQRVVDKRWAKDATSTTLQKTYRGGSIMIVGANSPASLASQDIRLLILDEIDRYPPSAGKEGDPVEIALKRTTTFGARRRVIMTSSPTVRHGRIHRWHQLGDQRKYFVPCPGCGVYHTYEWANVRWDDDAPETARLLCPECGYAISEVERVALLQYGEWRPTNPDPDPGVVSFHLWQAYSPFSTLRAIVQDFLRAREAQKLGDPEPMITFQNTALGEPVDQERGEGVEAHALLLRLEDDWGDDVDAPDGVAVITAAIDTQDDRLEGLVVGWGLGDESWILDRWTIPGDTSLAAPWEELDRMLLTTYRHATGKRIGIHATAIDSAGHRTSMVYHYAAQWAARRVMAIIGRSGSYPIVSTPSPRRFGQGQRQCPLYTFGVDAAKALLISRLRQTEKGPGFIHLPKAGWCDAEFVEQLTSERLKVTHERGRRIERWIKLRPRNEALDLYVYALCAFLQQQPDFKRRQEWIRRLADERRRELPPPPPPPPPSAQPWIPPRPGWLRGRR